MTRALVIADPLMATKNVAATTAGPPMRSIAFLLFVVIPREPIPGGT